MRRIVDTHTFDRLALDEDQAEAALNPLAAGRSRSWAPMATRCFPSSRRPRARPITCDQSSRRYAAEGRSDYLVLQLPTGDMTFEEATSSIRLFIDEVMPHFV